MMKKYPRITEIGVGNDIDPAEYIKLIDYKEIDRKATLRAPDYVLIAFHVEDPEDWTGLPTTYLDCPTILIPIGKAVDLMNVEIG
jgi:hypothetical protein